MARENLLCSTRRTEDEGWGRVIINGHREGQTGLLLQIFLLAFHPFPVQETVREMLTKYYEKSFLHMGGYISELFSPEGL